MKSEVIIVGGGASGLVAGIVSARCGRKVTILEHKDRIGKKILATGNGKCNYTNLHQGNDCYRCDEDNYAMEVLKNFNVEQTIDFFKQLGIYPKVKNGYLYPNSEQATSILEVLHMELEHLGVTVLCNEDVQRIIYSNDRFQVTTQKQIHESKKVILSTGGCASLELGSDGSGYGLAKAFGHSIVTVVPALTALHSPMNYFKAISGVRVESKLTLLVDNAIIRREEGELQLTNYGISGIPVFQLSRFAAKALNDHKSVTVLIDLLPTLTQEETFLMLEERKEIGAFKTVDLFLIGLFNRKLIAMLIKEAGLALHMRVSKLTQEQLQKLVHSIKEWSVTINGTNSFEQAQCCAGGVSVKEVYSDTMESKLAPNLYITGELLDVDGTCGGYNLQWAWTTGYIAGQHAGK